MISSLTVVGVGKLGVPMAVCFAARGFAVHALDITPQKVDAIGRGVPAVHEPGLEELLRESGGCISTSRDIEGAVRESDATFVVVAIPSEPDGGFSLRYALPMRDAIGRALGTKKTFGFSGSLTNSAPMWWRSPSGFWWRWSFLGRMLA